MNNNTHSSDVIVIGGGLVGSSVAYGLLRQGLSVTVLDGADDTIRPSRGNFGLVCAMNCRRRPASTSS